MRYALHLVTGCLTGMALLSVTEARAADAEDDRWQFQLTPYVFAAGLEDTLGVRGVEADVDVDFSDILDHLDLALMGAFEARRGRWGILFDGLYTKLSGEASRSWQGPLGIGSATGTLEVTTRMQVYQLAAAYRIGTRIPIDLIGGARYTEIDNALDLTVTTGGLLPGGTRSLSADEIWWDPLVGARVILPFAERWTVALYGDVGGFGVGSDFTYQVIAGVNWHFSKGFSADAGYRYLYQDFEDDGLVWDIAMHGPFLGLGIRF